ncbi:MAG TPA: efflux RND transporter periplasmic adaptor subunit, partial [Usitatibacter sp.]
MLAVDVDGELVAVRTTDLGPPVVPDIWEFKITLLAPEGTQVKKGDPVVAFDPSPLQRHLEEKSAEYQEAAKKIDRKEVELLGQRHDLELLLAEAESRLDKARLKDDVPHDLRARNEVLQTVLDLRNATDARGNLAARIEAVRRSEEAALRALVSQRDRAKARVAELEAGISAMTVRAPQDGIVIYRTGWRDEKKKVGDSTWFGEKLIGLPDLAQMRAEGDVDEADGGRIGLGQRVTLRLDALPDRDVKGRVAKIARAVRRKSFRVPNKIFKTEIALDASDAAFRPAMHFRGEIETGVVRGALIVPREAVCSRPGGPVVWVKQWRGFRETPVAVGAHDKRSFEVKAGLALGDEVALADLAE